jgi:undecaprenyl diphosphate synthase
MGDVVARRAARPDGVPGAPSGAGAVLRGPDDLPLRRPGDPVSPPYPHPDGARPPDIPADLVPRHVALVMDGNGRWAKARGLPRTEGHKRGEAQLLDVVAGCIEVGVKWISAYAFSTENWRRSPAEVRFLLGFNRDVIRRRREQMHAMGVRVRWAGRRPRLWRSVITELETAEELTRDNDVVTLTMCVNYGGRAEIADAARQLARLAARGELDPEKIDERLLARYLDEPDMPDVDLFIRSSGEQRSSNFLLWQSAYAEFVFDDTLFPDFDRRHLWRACQAYAQRDRRYGGALDTAPPINTAPQAAPMNTAPQAAPMNTVTGAR